MGGNTSQRALLVGTPACAPPRHLGFRRSHFDASDGACDERGIVGDALAALARSASRYVAWTMGTVAP